MLIVITMIMIEMTTTVMMITMMMTIMITIVMKMLMMIINQNIAHVVSFSATPQRTVYLFSFDLQALGTSIFELFICG